MNPMILMQFAPLLMKAIKATGGISNYPNLNNAINNGYDIRLMENSYPGDINNPTSVDTKNLDYLYSKEGTSFPTTNSGSGIAPSEGVLNVQNLTPQNINQQLNDRDLGYGTGYHPAEMSALAMLSANPKIGLPNDPMMLPYEDPMSGFTNNYNTATAIPTISNITDGSPYGLDDMINDDNPDDKLSMLARKLIRGR